MRKTLAICLLYLIPTCVSAQPDLSRYFDYENFTLIDPSDHLDIKFSWTIKGKGQAFMNEGLNEYLEGNLNTAIANFDETLKLDSTFWPAYYYRALAYKNAFLAKESEADFKKAIAYKPNVPEMHIELGELYQLTKKFQLAKTEYETALDLNPSGVYGYYFLGNLYTARGDYSRALKQYEKCNEIDPKFPNAYWTQGMLTFKVKKKDAEVNFIFFNKAIAADSTYTPAIFWRGLLSTTFGKTDQALIDFNRVVRLKPNNYFYLQMRGALFIEMERYNDAFRDFRKVLQSSNTNENRYTGGSTELDKRTDLKNAAGYLIMKGYGLDENSFNFLKQGFCLLLAKKQNAALQALNHASQIQASSSAYFLKGIAFEQLKEYDSSLVNYTKAIRLDNDIYDAHKKRALYRSGVNNWKGAFEDLNEMKRISPEAQSTYRLSGMIKANLKDYYGCIIDLAKFTKTDTTDRETWSIKAFCHSQVKDFKNAASDYERCIVLDPDNKIIFGSLYASYMSLKDSVAAFRTIKIMNSKWHVPYYTLNLAQRFIQFGEIDSATFYLQNLIKEVTQKIHSQNYRDHQLIQVKSDALLIMCSAYEIKGDSKTGLDYLDDSIKLDPNNNDKVYYRVRLLLKLNNEKEAIKELKKLRSANYTEASAYYQKYLAGN